MFHMMYASDAATTFNKSQLTALLARAREKNRRLGITGMLIHKNDRFVQVLEGDEAIVKGLYATISGDSRHTGITVLAEGQIAQRNFQDWSMGFHDLDHSDVLGLYGHSRPLGKSMNIDALKTHPDACLDLLRFIGSLRLTRT